MRGQVLPPHVPSKQFRKPTVKVDSRIGHRLLGVPKVVVMVSEQSELKKNPPIILAGSGRSGTTWFTDMLTLPRDYRSIFEPLHFGNVPNVGKNWSLYLQSHDEHAWLEDHLNKVFFTRADRAWMKWMTCRVDRKTPWYSKPFWYVYNLKYYRPRARHRVVKMIKANLMLPWLVRKWQPKIVFMTRHPGGVLSSRTEMGWKSNPERFLQQPELVKDYLRPYRRMIREAGDDLFRRETLMWCIENLIPQRQIADGQVQVHDVTYENLLLNTESVVTGILNYLEYPTAVHDLIISRCIQTIGPDQANRIDKWKQRLTPEQQDYMWEAVERFGIQVAS